MHSQQPLLVLPVPRIHQRGVDVEARGGVREAEVGSFGMIGESRDVLFVYRSLMLVLRPYYCQLRWR